ncbi:hypothetical protein BJ138DRAFT_1018631, partial [Hygrophoropsis aurantiaca]
YTALLSTYVQLESEAFGTSGSTLSSKSRPKEVLWWIARKRIPQPAPLDVDTFAQAWWTWWQLLQPEWRTVSIPSKRKPVPPQDHRDQGDWSVLDQPGQNGLLSVIACIKWWGAAKGGQGHTDKRWHAAVEDFEWVMRCIRKGRKSYGPGPSSKRTSNDVVEGSRKRPRRR